ncbi:MAG: CDP-alcohol phosphatidyltransferase family protein, partial [Firmicutes bacterium]|nr:CDP-alcohol phosphatidyltransferase family protein [Bacillota bacterium]
MIFKAKYIPNALTISRIVISVVFIILTAIPATTVFSLYGIILYIVVGVTDTLDGKLARKIPGAQSEKGAILDTIADIFAIIVCSAVFFPAMVNYGIAVWMWLMWLYLAFIIIKLIIPGIYAIKKFKVYYSVDTWAYKYVVNFMFAVPILYYFLRNFECAVFAINIYALIVIIACYIFVVEEMVCIKLLNQPEGAIRFFWQAKRFNEAAAKKKLEQ